MKNIALKIKKGVGFNWEMACVYIFYALAFFLPLFFLPLAVKPVAFAKSFLFYFATSLAFIFWLFSQLQKGRIKFLKSGLIFSAGGVAAAWLISSIFSLNPSLSFFGAGYEIGTFAFFAFLGISLFLVSMLFQDEKRAAIFYLALTFSSFLVFLLQVFHTVFKISILPSSIFSSATGNTIGSWNDFAVFFGLIALSALCFLELANLGKLLKALFYGVVIMSLLAMLAVNFLIAWIIFGFFVLVLFVYLFYSSLRAGFSAGASRKDFVSPKIIRPSFFILILVLFFIFARGWLGDFTNVLNTGATEVRPSWGITADVVWQSLKENPALGSGPNTFLYDWLKYKPASINGTMFWGARFVSGIGHLPSMVATAGILGAAALLIFLFFVISYGAKILSYGKSGFKKMLMITSFLGSLYLLLFTIFYSPGFLIFALAFLLLGILAGILAEAGTLKTVEISFMDKPKAGFVSVLLIFLIIIGVVFSLSVMFRQYHAERYYTKAVETLSAGGNLGKAEVDMGKAALIGKQDVYFRELSKINLAEISQILSQQGVSKDVLRSRFQNALGAAIANAQKAAGLNPIDILNWMQLGAVYESVIPFKVPGAGELAINSYKKALAVSPLDPSPFLAMARVSLASGDTKAARNYIKSSLGIKGDFAPAYFLLSQVEAKDGNLKEAVRAAEQTALIAPNDTGALFQLGVLNYRVKNYSRAQAVFNRIISLSPDNSNANYFLGLIYDKLGAKQKAIGVFEKIEKMNPGNEEVKLILENLRSGKPALSGISSNSAASSEGERGSAEKK
ncbi:MAG: tetratricopeptide repeat protein [bacterium]|nr:tetratricopeptide repeat protein [bacterium]